MITATALMDERERYYRHREMMACLEPFTQMLAHIYTIMPNPGYVIDLTNNTFEPLPPLPEWQEIIDKVIEMRNEYIKNNFPEFYEH